MSAVRFLVDGERIQPTQSPEDLDMEDGDTIEVMMYEEYDLGKSPLGQALTHDSEQLGGQ